MTRLTSATAAAFLTLLALTAPPAVAPATAQTPRSAVEVSAGNTSFADDGVVNEGTFGGSFRFYLTPRISAGPEVVFMQGERHSHVMVTGNVTFDFLGPRNGTPPALTPFVVAGGGVFRTRESFPFEDFASNDPAFTAGGGVRGRVGERLILGGEARIGWELHLRVNAFVGVRF